MVLDGVDGRRLRGFAPNAQRVSVVGDFNFWDGRRIPCACAASASGRFSSRARSAGDHYKYEIIGRRRPALPLKSDPLAFAAELRPQHGLDRRRPDARLPHPRAGARRRQRAERADLDLRGASRLVAAQGRQRMADLSRTGRAAAAPMRAISASPMSNSCRSPSIRSTAPGAISRPACLRRPAGSARPQDFAALVDACHRAGLGVLLDWVPGHFPTIRTGSAVSTAPRFTSTPIRGRAGISTGTR